MSQYTYAFQKDAEKTARAVGRSVPISPKVGVEICNLIRYKSVSQARNLLENAIAMKQPLPFHRYVNGLGHKPGMGPGRYNPTAARHILATINGAAKNAEVKNLGSELIIIHACSQRAARSFKYGRQSRQKEKRAHIEIVLAPKAVKAGAGEKATSADSAKSKPLAKKQKPAKQTSHGPATQN
jgi:large subunit ribosomal protein L22